MKDAKRKDLIVEDADKELYIDQENLNEELMDQPLALRKWIKLKAQVNKRVRVITQKLKETEAKIHLQFSERGGRVKDVESNVELHPDVIKLRNELIDAEELSEEYEGIARAFFQRHEALKEVCANIRKELAE